MSMIREVTDRGLKRHIHLIYGCEHTDDIIYQEELEDRRRRHGNLQVTPVISDPPPGFLGLTGFITANLIRKTLGDVSPKTFYVCGPEEMYAFCLAELEKLGVPKKRIRLEVFGPPQDVTTQPGWPGDLSRDATFSLKVIGGRTIAARAGEPMMISLEKAGIPVPASCRSGECSLCRTKLVAGKVFQPQGTKLRKSDRLFGYIHPCLAYPLEDCEIMI